MIYAYKYTGISKCNKCGDNHFYMTCNHRVITGEKDDLIKFKMPLSKIIEFDVKRSDIKKTINIKEAYKEWFDGNN